MARAGKFYLGLVTAVIFILLEIAAISLLKRSSTLQNIWINRISHNVMATSWGGLTKVRNYFGLREQNEILAGRNYELFKELQHYKELEKTMNAMARLDSASLPSRFNYIPAEITARGTNSRHNYIILDKGSEHGVKPQSAIITPNGVVGMIYAVDRRYSYGLSLLNDKVSVSARIGREGLVAPLSWDGHSFDRAILKDIPLHLTVAEGDTVRTSGISAVYPPDIPIGVTTGSRLIDGAVNVVDVQVLLDNFFPLSRYVLISVLPALILVLPVDTRPIAAMLLSFALGLVVDFFSNGMLGMSSLALVPVGLVRSAVIAGVFGDELTSRGDELSVHRLGVPKMVLTCLILCAVYFVVYVLVDSAGTVAFWPAALRFGLSILVSTPVCVFVVRQFRP